MASGWAGTAAAVATMALLLGACASEAEGGSEAVEPPTTDRPTTTTVATTTTTITPAGATAGDLAACGPYGELVTVWGAPTVDPVELQSAVEAVLDEAWQAEDPELTAALQSLRTGVNGLDVEATGSAAVAYADRCSALGAPL